MIKGHDRGTLVNDLKKDLEVSTIGDFWGKQEVRLYSSFFFPFREMLANHIITVVWETQFRYW